MPLSIAKPALFVCTIRQVEWAGPNQLTLVTSYMQHGAQMDNAGMMRSGMGAELVTQY
jgi:hypothetical protein